MSAWRVRFRDTAESALTSLDAPALARRAYGDRRVILSYHNVVSDPGAAHGDTSLHLPLPAFCAHMRELVEHYTVVSLAAMRSPASHLDKPRVAITFDDAYAGAVRNALPYLAEAALPVTMFVAPAQLGGQSFWWDAVEGADGTGPTTAFRTEVLETLRGDDATARANAARFRLTLREVPAESLSCSEAELRAALAANPLLSLGSHSWSHPSLPALDNGALRGELEESIRWIQRFGGRGVPWIAYPYGRVSRMVEHEAARAGFLGGVTIGGGAVAHPERHPFTLPRINVASGISERGFALRVAGVVR